MLYTCGRCKQELGRKRLDASMMKNFNQGQTKFECQDCMRGVTERLRKLEATSTKKVSAFAPAIDHCIQPNARARRAMLEKSDGQAVTVTLVLYSFFHTCFSMQTNLATRITCSKVSIKGSDQ